MSQLSDAIKRFKNELLNLESETSGQLASYYADAYLRITTILDELTLQLADEFEAAGIISQEKLWRNWRYQLLLRQIRMEVDEFAGFADNQITAGQGQAVLLADQHSRDLIELAPGPLPRRLSLELARPSIPVTGANFDAVRELVGRMSNGAPLADLLDTLGPEALTKARTVMVENLVTGAGPTKAAAALKEDLQIPLFRASAIARTEMIGSYRAAAIQTYEENTDTVTGWRWTCDVGIDTCGACLAMDGAVFPVGTPFATHVNCRCSPIPVTKSWEELGFEGVPDRRPKLELGEDWFDKQSPEKQKEILGPAKYEAFRTGELDLKELVGYREDEVWGPQRWERSLKDIREGNFIPPAHALGKR